MILRPQEDGITHVNVYSRGKTELGKLLSNFAFTPFTVPEHGSFASIEGYWYWLSTKDEKLRHLYGYQAKAHGRAARIMVGHNPVPDFQTRIKIALDAKLNAHPRIVMLLRENTLPLVHYYVTNGIVQNHTASNQWILDHFKLWSISR